MKLFIVLFLLFTSCFNGAMPTKPPLGYSVMPKYVDIYEIKPYDLDDTSRVVDSTYRDFRSIPLDSGKHISIYDDTLFLPPGILISDRNAALFVFYRAGWERQNKELEIINNRFKNFRNIMDTVETAYQKEIVQLRQANERTWLEKNIGYIGFITGVMTTILIYK